MASKTRRLDVVISGEDRSAGKTFKNVGEDADKLGDHLKTAGEKAGRGFGRGVGDGVDGSGLTGRLKSLGEKVSGAFKGALIAGGVAAAALFAQGFAQELDNEFASDKFIAQLGGGQWAEDMGQIASNLYLKGFGESLGDVGAVLRDVLQGGLLHEDASDAEIEALTQKVLTFADVLDQDANMAVQALQSILTSGLAEDGASALDVLTRGIQQGADKAGDLLETFQEYSTTFREVGIDAADAVGLMLQGLRGGARDADKVADAIKEFGIRAKDGSKTTTDAYEAIGLSADDMSRRVAAGGDSAREALSEVLTGLRNMEDPVARNAAAVGLFGTQAEDLGDALFSLDLGSAAQGLGDLEGSTDDLGEAYDNLKSKIETFKRQALEKVVTFIEQRVVPKLQEFKTWIENNEGAVKVFGGILLGFIGTALAAYIASMVAAAAATIAATWPILAMVGAVAGLTAATQWLIEKFNGPLNSALQLIVDVGAKVLGFFSTAVSLVKKLAEWAIKAADALARIKIPSLPGGGGSLPFLGPLDPTAGVPFVPFLDEGGVMPGKLGVHYPAMVAGGETVLPTHKPGFSMNSGPQVIQLVVDRRVLAEVIADEQAVQSRNRAL